MNSKFCLYKQKRSKSHTKHSYSNVGEDKEEFGYLIITVEKQKEFTGKTEGKPESNS